MNTLRDLVKFLVRLICRTPAPPPAGWACSSCRTKNIPADQRTASGRCCFCAQWEDQETFSGTPALFLRSDGGPRILAVVNPDAPPVNLDDVPNPIEYRGDDFMGRAISITIPWVRATGTLLPVIVTRDPGCLWTKILIGLGDDGSPNSTTRQFTVPFGTLSIQVAQLANRGVSTIHDILDAGQITVGN